MYKSSNRVISDDSHFIFAALIRGIQTEETYENLKALFCHLQF